MAVPQTTRALIIKGKDETAIEEVPVPALPDGYMLVRTKAVALNPTDWKHIAGFASPDGEPPVGARVGCDFSGVVLKTGIAVKGFKPGDRVAGMCHGSNYSSHEDGAFGNIIIAKAKAAIRIPDNVTDNEAAMLGVAVPTVGQSLYFALNLPQPTTASTIKPATPDSPALLIYGGSSSMGLMGIQYAKLSGYRVLTTASPRNFGLLRSIGADDVFDYHSATCGADIRAATDSKLKLAWDCIGGEQALQICNDALSEEGGQISRFSPAGAMREGVKTGSTLAYIGIGEAFTKFGREFPADMQEMERLSRFWELTREILAAGLLKAVGGIVNRGGEGLEGIQHGLGELKAGKVSGGKLVYSM